MYVFIFLVKLTEWPPIGKIAAHSACDMFHGISTWLLVWFFPTSVFGVGIFFWLRLFLIFAYLYLFFNSAATRPRQYGGLVKYLAYEIQCLQMPPPQDQDHKTEMPTNCLQHQGSTATGSRSSPIPRCWTHCRLDLENPHSNITSKANRILSLLGRHLYSCSQEVKSRAFTSLARPHLEYSSSVWDPYLKQDILTIEKVQRKGARFVTGNYSYRDSVTSMLNDLQWPPMQDRRRSRRLTHLYKAVNNLSPVKIPEYVTHEDPWPCLYTADNKLRAVQVQLPAQNHQGLERTTPGPCARPICRRVPGPSAEIHSLDNAAA